MAGQNPPYVERTPKEETYMNETRPAEAPTRRKHRRLRYTSPRVRRVAAGVYWGVALVVFAFAAWVWSRGAFTPVFATAVGIGGIGCLLGGFLALSGDSDLAFFTGLDEAQRAASMGAQAIGFCVTFLGLFALWIAYQLVPSWQADAGFHIGILLFLGMMTYLGAYLIRRRRM